MSDNQIADPVRCGECNKMVPADQIVTHYGPGVWSGPNGWDWEPHDWCRPCHDDMFN